jgi:hypothetical protein
MIYFFLLKVSFFVRELLLSSLIQVHLCSFQRNSKLRYLEMCLFDQTCILLKNEGKNWFNLLEYLLTEGKNSKHLPRSNADFIDQ